MLTFDTLTDARTYVLNSGVVDWDWGTADDDVIMETLLPNYLYHRTFCCLNAALQSFITEILKQENGRYQGIDCHCVENAQ